ncbi:MAG: hypothetical protein OXD46_14950 [Chloroflexi bacterium]|nr:hypothetical protein [Chloroflexota bacterium]
MIFRYVVAFAATITLAACGGGGASTSSQPDPRPNDAPKSSSIDPNVAYVGDFLVYIDGKRYVMLTDCDGFDCQSSHREIEDTIPFHVSDFDPTTETNIGSPTKANGIEVAKVRKVDDGEIYDYYAGWGEHNAFLTAVISYTTPDGIEIEGALPLSMGVSSGTSPVAGSGTWTGAMLGMSYSPRPFYSGLEKAVMGDALLTVDFHRMEVDVTFSSIRERGTGGDFLPDMTWDGLPIRSGEFQGEGLDGQFYGPNHEEAGGIFEAENPYRAVIGAFGAQRD